VVSEDNLDSKVISDFGDEWAKYGYASNMSSSELTLQFQKYSELVNFSEFDPQHSTAADFGAGTGRWTQFILQNFRNTYLVEPSDGAFQVLESKFAENNQVTLENTTISNCAIPEASLDFAMSLGVLHHISDTIQALKDINKKLKNKGLFLGYLYYKVEHKPVLYRFIFFSADFFRKRISVLPFSLKKNICPIIAFLVYLPFAKISKFLNSINVNTSNIPLHQYANLNFYMMKNDALDRFGTKLEKRFNRPEIKELLVESGFDPSSIKFSESEPFWTFIARKLDT
jgi:ubiquinone/menaquinone biosynthesis C-methylase UbiE